MGVQAIYQTIGPKVLGKTKVFYCLIYMLGIGKGSLSSNPETCSMRPKLVDGDTGTRIPYPPCSSFGPSRDYGMDLCLEVYL